MDMNTMEAVKNLGESECIVDFLLKTISNNECKTCGKCVFGYEGITQLEMMLSDITMKKAKTDDKELMRDLCGQMLHQSICEIGSDIAEVMLFALDNKGEEIDEHLMKKSCRAGICKKFVTYHILVDKCIGCTDCADACEEGAILGKKRFVHVIDQSECTQCGACAEVCEEEAIIKAGAIKPRGPKKPIPCKKR